MDRHPFCLVCARRRLEIVLKLQANTDSRYEESLEIWLEFAASIESQRNAFPRHLASDNGVQGYFGKRFHSCIPKVSPTTLSFTGFSFSPDHWKVPCLFTGHIWHVWFGTFWLCQQQVTAFPDRRRWCCPFRKKMFTRKKTGRAETSGTRWLGIWAILIGVVVVNKKKWVNAIMVEFWFLLFLFFFLLFSLTEQTAIQQIA